MEVDRSEELFEEAVDNLSGTGSAEMPNFNVLNVVRDSEHLGISPGTSKAFVVQRKSVVIVTR